MSAAPILRVEVDAALCAMQDPANPLMVALAEAAEAAQSVPAITPQAGEALVVTVTLAPFTPLPAG